MKPLVSVVTPSYNQGQFIEKTILSVRDQDYPNIEHIVMDGGSTDNTLSILKRYEDSITWKSEADKGQSDGINKGFLKSNGEILAWLNSDDTYVPGAVRKAADFLLRHRDVDMIYGDCFIVDEGDEIIGRWVDPLDFDLDLLTTKALNFIPQPAVFFRRRVLDGIGLLDVGLVMAMDYDFWIRIGRAFKVKRLPEVLANFRLSPNSKSVAAWSTFWPEVLRVLIRHCGVKPLPWYFRRYYRAAKEHGYEPLDAMDMLDQAISEDPVVGRCRAVVRVKGLSQALMARARECYLLDRRQCGLRDLVRGVGADLSLMGSREFFLLGTKLLLGRGTIRGLKATFPLRTVSVQNETD